MHRLDTRWVFFLLTIATAQIALLAWAASGTAVTYVYVLSSIPVGIAAALFLQLRSLLAQQLLAFIGLLIGLGASFGYLTTAVVSVSVALVDLTTSFTVSFLTRASQRHRSFDNEHRASKWRGPLCAGPCHGTTAILRRGSDPARRHRRRSRSTRL